MTKSEAMGKEMTDILDKGFKELHMPFKAGFNAERKTVWVDSLRQSAHFPCGYKATASAYDNLRDFSNKLFADYRTQKSTDMQNIDRYGGYLCDTVDACAMYAANKVQNKNVFKKQHDRWEKFLAEDMHMAMCNARENGKVLGLSDATIMKLARDAYKKFQNVTTQEKAPMGR